MSRAIPILILLACVAGVGAEEVDPEPPAGGPELRQLKGTWTVTKVMFKGKELKPPRAMTYTFEGTG